MYQASRAPEERDASQDGGDGGGQQEAQGLPREEEERQGHARRERQDTHWIRWDSLIYEYIHIFNNSTTYKIILQPATSF